MKDKKENTYICLKCKGYVEKDAKQCPHCGRKYPRISLMLQGALILCIFLLVGLVISAIFSNSEEKVSTTEHVQLTSKVDNYIDSLLYTDLVKSSVVTMPHDTSNATRSRMQVWAYSLFYSTTLNSSTYNSLISG